MFHCNRSILLASLGLALTLGANMARAADANYMGRWTVSDEKPAYSSKGKLYKTIDIAPCGADFCGVAVSDNNVCGPTLFRFLTIHATNAELNGHGLWGSTKKKLRLTNYIEENVAKVYVGLADANYDFDSREASTPTFDANYKNIGKASCTTK
jgi:hypothetical protein